jgi:hypothetical protein
MNGSRIVGKREPMADQYGWACVIIISPRGQICVQFTAGKDELHIRCSQRDPNQVQVVSVVGKGIALDEIAAILGLACAIQDCVQDSDIETLRRILKRPRLTPRQIVERG